GAALRDLLSHLILPAVTLAAASVTIVARLTRSAMLETLGQDYVRTARAKGVSSRAVVLRHGLSNAMIPIITVVGVQAGYLLGGAVLTETVFAWPGVGTLMVQGILARDFPLVQGCVLVVALSFVLVNLAVDLLYAWFDPRIRYEGGDERPGGGGRRCARAGTRSERHGGPGAGPDGQAQPAGGGGGGRAPGRVTGRGARTVVAAVRSRRGRHHAATAADTEPGARA